MRDIGFEIPTYYCIIETADLLLCHAKEDDGIQVGKFKVVCSTECNSFKNPNIQPLRNIHTQVMHGHILLIQKIINTTTCKLRGEFSENILIIYFPHTRIDPQEKIAVA